MSLRKSRNPKQTRPAKVKANLPKLPPPLRLAAANFHDYSHLKVFSVDSPDMLESQWAQWLQEKFIGGIKVKVNTINVSTFHNKTVLVVTYYNTPN